MKSVTDTSMMTASLGNPTARHEIPNQKKDKTVNEVYTLPLQNPGFITFLLYLCFSAFFVPFESAEFKETLTLKSSVLKPL